jgi:ABC-type multidrug transport system ATPase subunit
MISKRVAGYVPQEDILMGSQTVREALNFYAELKLPKTMKRKEKHAIVHIKHISNIYYCYCF